MTQESSTHQNVYLTDENVDGPAVRLARGLGVEIIRDVDADVPCAIQDYDQCLFDYAVKRGYVLVTANIRHFEPKFYMFAQTGNDHPGLILIRREHRSSSYLIAEWLALWADEDFTNRLVRLPPD
jgi:hypothetical protein